MKFSAHAFGHFWDLHAWAGVISGLVLYVMFLAGSLTLFRAEVGVWQEPLAHQRSTHESHQAQLERALAAAPATKGPIWFYPATTGAARLSYREAATGISRQSWFDENAGRLVHDREQLAQFVFSVHRLSHDRTGEWVEKLAGVLAIVLLLTLVTGVLIHLKDIVRQFHQFRPQKSLRVLWSDMHKVLGVMGLPFQVLYAYTGAFLVLAPIFLNAFTGPLFGGDQQRASQAFWGLLPPPPKEAGEPAPALSIDDLGARARRALPNLEPDAYRLFHRGFENGVVEVRGRIRGDNPKKDGIVLLSATDGRVLGLKPVKETAYAATSRWMFGLHEARFGGAVLHVLFFFLALATALTILTGNWIWIERRVATRNSIGNRMLARLTLGVGGGGVVALATLFLVSRVFPLEWGARGNAEELTFVVVFLACIGWAFVARVERAVWWQQLGLAGILLLPVPLLAARYSSAGLFGSGLRHATVVGVDVAILVAALSLCATAWGLRRASLRPDRSAAPGTPGGDPTSAPGSELEEAGT